MREFRKWLRAFVKTKKFHAILMIVIIIVLVLIATGFIINYQFNGETEMPFEIKKINVVSSVSGDEITAPTEEEKTDNRWNVTVSENNDLYFYIEKNDNYHGRIQESIQAITFDNFKITKQKRSCKNI